MQAVILAAGKSSRFYPFTALAHKSMLSMFGKSLLQHTLESLKKSSITKVIIIIGKNSSIPQDLERISGMDITYVTQSESLGMGHGLLSAKEYLEDTFLLLSGYHVDVSEFAHDLSREKNTVTLLVKKESGVGKFGVVETEGRKVISVTEKPEEENREKLRIISIYQLTKSFVSFLATLPIEEYHFEKALDTYAKDNTVLFVERNKSTVSLKNTWDILEIKDYMLSTIQRKISSKARIAKSAIIDGSVFISDNVTILENAVVKGPCYLGENVTVGTNAILRNGVVAEKGVVIGATMEVKNSLLMTGVTTHTGFIGDSIIGAHSRLAAGFCSANVRFDRKGVVSVVKGKEVNTQRVHFGAVLGEQVDTGVNVTTMPGVCIGNKVRIGPATVVMKNVEDNKLVYTKFETVIKQNNE